MLQVLLQLMSAQTIYSVSSFLFFNMKRPRDDADWRQQRCTKILAGSSYWDGCPYCNRRQLSYNEWASFATNFQNKESEECYECCKSCLRDFMEKHWAIIKWWKWNGEGDA